MDRITESELRGRIRKAKGIMLGAALLFAHMSFFDGTPSVEL